MDLLSQYERELKDSRKTILGKLASIPQLRLEERQNEIKATESAIEEAEEIVQTMRLGASGNPTLKSKVDDYKEEITLWKKQLAQARQTLSRNELLEIDDDEVRVTLNDGAQHRNRFEESTERLYSTGNNFKQTLQVLNETHETADESAEQLEQQREKLQGIRARLGRINDLIGQAGRSMRKISRQLMMNRIFVVGLCLVMSILIAIGIFLGIFLPLKLHS